MSEPTMRDDVLAALAAMAYARRLINRAYRSQEAAGEDAYQIRRRLNNAQPQLERAQRLAWDAIKATEDEVLAMAERIGLTSGSGA